MLTAEHEREWLVSRGLSMMNDWKDAAEFEASVAQRLVQHEARPDCRGAGDDEEMSIYEQPIYCPSCGCKFYEVKKVKPGRLACVCPNNDCGMQGPHRTTRKAAIRDFMRLVNVESVKDAVEFEARVQKRLMYQYEKVFHVKEVSGGFLPNRQTMLMFARIDAEQEIEQEEKR